MEAPNHAALGEGIKLYTDAMRALVEQRLQQEYGDTWWDDGVVSALNPSQQANLSTDMATYPLRNRVDYLDAGHFVWIIRKSYERAFRDVFPNIKKCEPVLRHIVAARNEWAHAPSGDVNIHDTIYTLQGIELVLSAAKHHQAAAVRELRRATEKRRDILEEEAERQIPEGLGDLGLSGTTGAAVVWCGRATAANNKWWGMFGPLPQDFATENQFTFASQPVGGQRSWKAQLEEIDVEPLEERLIDGQRVWAAVFSNLAPGRYMLNRGTEPLANGVWLVYVEPDKITEIDWREDISPRFTEDTSQGIYRPS